MSWSAAAAQSGAASSSTWATGKPAPRRQMQRQNAHWSSPNPNRCPGNFASLVIVALPAEGSVANRESTLFPFSSIITLHELFSCWFSRGKRYGCKSAIYVARKRQRLRKETFCLLHTEMLLQSLLRTLKPYRFFQLDDVRAAIIFPCASSRRGASRFSISIDSTQAGILLLLLPELRHSPELISDPEETSAQLPAAFLQR